MFGDLFLKHFYSIYDFDQELISLGINKHSEGIVRMYPVDGKPVQKESKAKTTVNSAFQTAVDSEGLTGRKAMKGTDMKLDADMNSNKGEFAAREEKAEVTIEVKNKTEESKAQKKSEDKVEVLKDYKKEELKEMAKGDG